MKTKFIPLCLPIALLIPSLVFGADMFEKIESEVYQAEGTKQELIKRGKSCFLLHVVNEDVFITDSSQGATFFSAVAGGEVKGESHSIGGGDLFVDIDEEEGRIIANNTVDFKSMWLNYNTKTRMTFLAKDGRFKISHTDIKFVQKDTGFSKNTGYKAPKKRGFPKEKVFLKVLGEVTDKVASCVQSAQEKEDW